jgi:hypothetical protein
VSSTGWQLNEVAGDGPKRLQRIKGRLIGHALGYWKARFKFNGCSPSGRAREGRRHRENRLKGMGGRTGDMRRRGLEQFEGTCHMKNFEHSKQLRAGSRCVTGTGQKRLQQMNDRLDKIKIASADRSEEHCSTTGPFSGVRSHCQERRHGTGRGSGQKMTRRFQALPGLTSFEATARSARNKREEKQERIQQLTSNCTSTRPLLRSLQSALVL